MWEYLQDLEEWWPASNPEHISLERLDELGIAVGAQLRIRERVAGIPVEAEGVITRLEPPTAVSWEAPRARYRWLGISIRITEGVTWSLRPIGDSTRLSARVWAIFPPGPEGRGLE